MTENKIKEIESLLNNADVGSEWWLSDDTIFTPSGGFIEFSVGLTETARFVSQSPEIVAMLLKRVEELSEALQFYAPEVRYGATRVYVSPHYRELFPITVAEDRGLRARKALGWE